MSVAFSSDGVKAIERKVDVGILGDNLTTEGELSDYYEIERCKNFILNNGFNKVALQFPDDLLCDSTLVATKLAKETRNEVFILGDTSYGSCCVDEVAAEHNAADCIIHFGPSCLTRTERLPVLLVFGKEKLDMAHCSHCFREAFPSKDHHVLVLYDTVYSHCVGELRERLADYKECVISHLDFPESMQGVVPLASVPESIPPVLSAGPSPCSGPTTSSIQTLSAGGTIHSQSITAITPSTASPAPLSADFTCSPDVDTGFPSTAVSAASNSTLSSAEATPITEAAAVLSCRSSQCLCMTTGGIFCEQSRTNCDVEVKTCSTCGDNPSNSLVQDFKDQPQTEKSTLMNVQRLSHQKELFDGNKNSGEGNIPACNQGLEMAHRRFGRYFQLASPIEEHDVFFIGKEGPCLSNFLLNYSKCQFSSYNPVARQWRKESISVNKTLGKRYYLVQKAKEARTVGIIVGTLGAADYLEVIERLKQVLKQAGKKYYTIAVGKLNVPKIANFLEIDIFVLVACPENSLISSQEFFRPVITPYELELACIRSKEWTGEYTTDYQELLPGASFYTSLDDEKEEVEPEFSLITGSFVPNKESSQSEQDHSMALQARSKMEVAEQDSASKA